MQLTVEKLTLTSQCHEITVNNGSFDGAVDLFSYGPESGESLGSLHVVGHRENDSSNMGYIVSLVAALARREYYAQPDAPARDAFARMLRKVNEIVDDFFKSADVELDIGIFAVAGSTVIVSKLDKFRILLARDGQTIDVLNNVGLFTKEHVQKRRFSSIISGSVQAGDRILAYYPSKPVVARERTLKSTLIQLAYPDFVEKMEDLGRQYPTFATAMLCVDMTQTSERLTEDRPSAHIPVGSPALIPQLAWSPRQSPGSGATIPPAPMESEQEVEVPHIISTEFSLGTRRNPFTAWLGHIKFVRLDTRAKALFLGVTALVVIGGVLIAKSFLLVNPEQQKLHQTVQSVKTDFDLAKSKTNDDPAQARQILMRALSTLSENRFQQDSDARNLTASLVSAMDTLDNAQAGTLSLVATLDPDTTGHVLLATWSSASSSLWAVAKDPDSGTTAVLRIAADGSIADRTELGEFSPSAVIPFKTGVLVIDAAAQKIARVIDGRAKVFTLPIQEALISAVTYQDTVYALTDTSMLKISDLDTDKPVTKQWLTDNADLAPEAAQLSVDGSITTLGRDGVLAHYYKGKKTSQTQTALEPSGNWHLVAGPQADQLAVANADTKRVYIIDAKDGSLVRTLKIDTQQQILDLLAGPNGSTLFVTKDNKIWSVQ